MAAAATGPTGDLGSCVLLVLGLLHRPVFLSHIVFTREPVDLGWVHGRLVSGTPGSHAANRLALAGDVGVAALGT